MPLGFNGGIRVDDSVPGTLKIFSAKYGKHYIYTAPKDFMVCVSVGDSVSHDDCIAVHADGSVLCCAVSGTIEKVVENRIYITSDEGMPPLQYPLARDIGGIEKDEIVDHIRLAGLISEGGVPIWRMLQPLIGKGETLIINAAETNPGVSCRRAVLRAYPEKVIGGIKIVMRALSLGKAILVMTEHMQTEAGSIRAKLDQKNLIDIYGMAAKYPAENDRVVFSALTGCTVEPSSRRAVILSVHDCISIYDLLVHGRHQAIRTVTVQDQNVNVPIGTPISLIPELYGLKVPKQSVAYVGGGCGCRVCAEDDAVNEQTTAIFYSERISSPQERNCIGCGRCHVHCPIGLMPNKILDAISDRSLRKLTWYQVEACIQCGTCSAVCPSYRMPFEKIGAYLSGMEFDTSNECPITTAAEAEDFEAMNASEVETDIVEEIGVLDQITEANSNEESFDAGDEKLIGSIDDEGKEGAE